jgi:prepilin-type N-terminal cleavage/methylation domain-containing protein/prepilin-type processing-associated H-X9-DG protein
MSKRAFTLIELLVVISVMALLMAILLPSLHRVRRQAKAVACQSNLRQWSLVLSTYTSDYDGKFIPAGTGPYIWRPLLPYCPDFNDLLLCPAASKPIGPQEPYDTWIGAKFSAWAQVTPPPRRVILKGSYGLNYFVLHLAPAAISHEEDCWQTCLNQGGNNIPVFLDCRGPGLAPIREQDPPPEYEDQNMTWKVFGRSAGRMWLSCTDRHDGSVNALFMDWSTRKVGLKELWTLKWHREFNTAGCWTKAGGVRPEDWPKWMRHFKDY